jgi:hypothetical protein
VALDPGLADEDPVLVRHVFEADQVCPCGVHGHRGPDDIALGLLVVPEELVQNLAPGLPDPDDCQFHM